MSLHLVTITVMNSLKVKNLQVLDLQPWSLELMAGEVIYLSGPSGSGKSKLLRAIADLDQYQGEVALALESSQSMPGHSWRTKVALVPAESAWWGALVGDHFSRYELPQLQQLGFDEEVMGWQIDRLSSGEKQRLALLRALASWPRVLLLDEPTANLDRDHGLQLESMIDGLCKQQDVAVIWVTHDREQQRRVATRGFQIVDDAVCEVKS